MRGKWTKTRTSICKECRVDVKRDSYPEYENYDDEGEELEANSYPELEDPEDHLEYIDDHDLNYVDFSDDVDNLETISGVRYAFNGPKFSSDSESNEDNSSEAEDY